MGENTKSQHKIATFIVGQCLQKSFWSSAKVWIHVCLTIEDETCFKLWRHEQATSLLCQMRFLD